MSLLHGELVIEDHNAYPEPPPGIAKGHVARSYAKVPFGALPGATAFTLPLIPRSEWSARIKERKEMKALLSDRMLEDGIPSLNQAQTNYCWGNGVITGITAIRCAMNLPYVELSSASVCAPIKGYRNVGGWGGEALDYIVKNGVAPASLWPVNAIDRKYDNAESREARKKYIITEWWEMPDRSFDAKMTCLLLGLPVPSGYNHWSHETCGIDPEEIEPGYYGSRERNSWGDSYGQKGFFIFGEGKSTPDDAVCPAVTLAA